MDKREPKGALILVGINMNKVREIQKDDVFAVLRHVYDPDYWVLNKSIIDKGLVHEDNVKITSDRIHVEYNLEASFCVFASEVGAMIKYALEKKLNRHTVVRLKSDHPQSEAVNRILQNDRERDKLLKKLDYCGVLVQCVRTRRKPS